MRLRAIATVVLVALVGAPACSGDDERDAYRLELDGRARVTAPGENRTLDEGEHTVRVGDTVRMLDGDAVLKLPGERELWLRATDGDASIVEIAATPNVVDGDVVALGEDGLHVTAGDVDVRVARGAARVQRGLGVTVGMYRGSAAVRSAGRSLDGGLPALRQVSVAATGLLPRKAVPLVYDDKDPDPWDQRFLGDAIELGGFLDTQSRGFTSQLGPVASVDAALLERVLPPLADQAWLGAKLGAAERSAGEALVGAAIVVETGGPLEGRWDDVFSFRGAGARWGLVALDQQVKRDALKGRLIDAVGRSPLLFAAGPVRAGAGGRPTSTTQAPPVDEGTTSTTEPGPSTTEPPPTTVPPTTVPPLTLPPLTPDPPSDPGGASPGEPDGVVDVLIDLLGAAPPAPG